MSIKTWKEEFYPVKPRKRMTTKEAIEHSLRKWEGLRKSNLKKHGLVQNFFGDSIIEADVNVIGSFDINSESCSLCTKFFTPGYEEDEYGDFVFIPENKCHKCPLVQVLGEPCDASGDKSVYGKWVDGGNPVPMITALKKCLRKEEKNDQ